MADPRVIEHVQKAMRIKAAELDRSVSGDLQRIDREAAAAGQLGSDRRFVIVGEALRLELDRRALLVFDEIKRALLIHRPELDSATAEWLVGLHITEVRKQCSDLQRLVSDRFDNPSVNAFRPSPAPQLQARLNDHTDQLREKYTFEIDNLVHELRGVGATAGDLAPAEPASPKKIIGTGDLTGPSFTMEAYGRADSKPDLQRTAEVNRELGRLYEQVLPSIPDRELSAYSTKSLPIATYLHESGHPFSVLTEEMLAEAFKDEFKRRETLRREEREANRREGWRSLLTPRYFVGTIILGVLGLVAKQYWTGRVATPPPAIEPKTEIEPSGLPVTATAAAPTAEVRVKEESASPENSEPAKEPRATVSTEGPPAATSDAARAEQSVDNVKGEAERDRR